MPPKESRNAQKRPHDGSDNSEPSAKSARTNDGQLPEEPGESSQTRNGSRKRRISRGPKGEVMMPQIMPHECAESNVIETIPMPSRWVMYFDAIPDRSLTLGSRRWWEDHGPWLDAHKKALKLSDANWKMRDEAMKQDDTVPDDEGADDWDFVCVSIPRVERGSLYDEDEEDEEDEESDDEEGENDNDPEKKKDEGEKPYNKLASLHPEWPWFFTMRGLDRYTWWEQGCLNRSQDDFGLYIYNDFSSYGMIELMENVFAQFSSVFKPTASYRDFWPEVEALALTLRGELLDYYVLGIDDYRRPVEMTQMVGYLILATIDALKKQDVFKPDSEIRNLGLVLFMLIRWGREALDYEISEESCSWIYKVIDLAEEAGIKFTAPHNFDTSFNEIMENRDGRAKQMKKWDNVKWPAKIKTYKSKHGRLGGHEFDITKFSKAKREEYTLGAIRSCWVM
ncbi:amine oxidase (flavin-containing) [Fusarium austroafricanum]|uniref:Amine oxidase (Flavin-containing) n=1 Tax=Fusarium austroafricanum TaxID=2364996 RepID=A0A8H4KEL1_9HYPO|nr:amine oxidase (flavin-containing) [Fusarium austroafricanum]